MKLRTSLLFPTLFIVMVLLAGGFFLLRPGLHNASQLRMLTELGFETEQTVVGPEWLTSRLPDWALSYCHRIDQIAFNNDFVPMPLEKIAFLSSDRKEVHLSLPWLEEARIFCEDASGGGPPPPHPALRFTGCDRLEELHVAGVHRLHVVDCNALKDLGFTGNFLSLRSAQPTLHSVSLKDVEDFNYGDDLIAVEDLVLVNVVDVPDWASIPKLESLVIEQTTNPVISFGPIPSGHPITFLTIKGSYNQPIQIADLGDVSGLKGLALHHVTFGQHSWWDELHSVEDLDLALEETQLKLRSIPPSAKLRHIRLTEPAASTLDALDHFPDLKSLGLIGVAQPPDLSGLSNLQSLYLGRCTFQVWENASHPMLETLTVFQGALESLDCRGFTALSRLNLRKLPMQKVGPLPPTLVELYATSLHLSKLGFRQALPELKALMLNFCELKQSPDLRLFPKLETLSLNGNPIAKLPDLEPVRIPLHLWLQATKIPQRGNTQIKNKAGVMIDILGPR